MNPDNLGQNNSSTEWIPLSEAAQFTPYSADYLSLLARKRRLTAKKIDGIWYTTKGIINNYLTQQAKRAEALNQNTDSYLPFISDSAKDVPEAPESNVQYSRTYADDFQKIRPATSEQVVAEETKSVTGSESSSVKLPPVLVPLNEIRSVNVATVSVKENLSREENKLTPAVGVAAPNYSSNEVSKTEVQVAASVDPLASKSVSGDALMEEFMRRFNAQIDRQVDSQHGFLFKISRFIRRSYGYTLRSPKRLPLFIVCLFLVVILPFRFVSGFADTFFTETMHAVKNAQTVMGFRPGTHENEILLLGPEGEIAIYGNVETEGQFRSYVEDGIAPITVKSTTKVDNLNADMLDGVSGHEFTLAYVTKNGNVTHEPVFLEGTVEVGQTLLVKGATKLLNSLQVDGNLSVFGEANFARGISVSGPAVFKNILTAPSVIVSDLLRAHKLIVEDESIFEGLVTIKDDLDVEGSITASSGRINGSFRVEEGFHAMQNVSLGSDAYTVRITSAEWSVDNDGNAVFADIIGEEASFSSLSVGGNASASTFTATNPNSTSTFQGALSVGTTTSYEMLTLDGALYLASIAAPSATSSRLHNQDGTLYWAGSAFAGPTLGTWSTDGTNVWRTTGNVGIGTSSPNAQLHVDGGDVLFNSAGGGPGFYFDESNGRLGLGTTTPAQTLTVVGSARITGSLFDSAVSAGTSGMILSSTGSGTSWIATSTLASNYFQQDGNSFGTTATLGTNDTNDLAFETDNSTRMTIDTNGNVGIGTTSPNQKFQVSGGGIKLDNNQNLIWRNSANTGDTSVLALSGDTTILRGGGGAPTMQLQTTGGSAIMSLLENGNVGIGTTTPTQLFSVAGNTYITGGLGIGIATTSSGVLETAGNARIGGDLAVVGTTTTDKLAVNSYVISDLIPEVNAFYNLGSSARYWNDAYIDTLTVNNISAASTSISGTQSESFTINSDNATADTENMDLVFYRGTVVPNALISWDAVRDRFDINQPFFIQNDSSTTTVVTLDVHGTAGQTADIFRVASSTGTSFLNVTTGGNVGIGETAPGSKLSVSGGGSFGASYDTTAAPTNGLIIEGNVGIGTTTPTTQLQLYRTSNAFPATSGSTQSAGQQLRLGGGAQAVLDFGSNGTSGAWIQSTLGTNLATNYPLLLNPNGGNVGIGTTSPSQMLSVGATTGSQFLVTSAGAVTDGSWTADVIADDYGGTGQSTYATGDILYASGANTLAKRTIGSTGNILSVVGGVPTWSATSTLGFTTASDFDTSAELAAILTDETGTGSVVFSASPTFTGVAAFADLTAATATTTSLITTNFTCTDCINASEIEDIYVLNTGDTMTGDLVMDASDIIIDNGQYFRAQRSTSSSTINVLGFENGTDNLFLRTGGSSAASRFSVVNTGATELLTILGTGNVGVGTTSPQAKLHVASYSDEGTPTALARTVQMLQGNQSSASNVGFSIVSGSAAGSYIDFGDKDDADAGALYYNNNTNSFGFYTNANTTERLTISSAGNVGIGTTTPDRRLNVVGASGTSVAKFDLVNATADTVLELSSDDGFIASGSNFLSWSDGGTTLGVIRGDGNVGIGTTAPGSLLTLDSSAGGTIKLQGLESDAGSNEAFSLTSDANGNGTLSLSILGTKQVYLSAWGGESSYIAAGNVGIGTTTPAAKLNVLSTTEQLRLSYNSTTYWTDTIASDGGRTLTGFGSDGDLDIIFTGATDGDFSINGDDLFVDTSAGGFVGIGDATPAALLTVGDGDLFQVNSSGAIAAVTGITTSGDIDIGSGAIIDFADAVADKIHWYSNTYGTGIESGTLTDWSGSQFRWRTGGTSASTGTERMLLTTTGLSVTGTVSSTGTMTEAGSAVLSAADINTCSELAALTSTTGSCGAFVLSASPTLTGTTVTATINMSSGVLHQTQSATYNVFLQGSAPGTAAGDARNIALIGHEANDDLILNYGTEYDCVSVGGTSCSAALSVTGGISTTGALDTAGAIGTYGSLTVDGSKNGYSGFDFEDVTATASGRYLMVHNTADIQGFLRGDGNWSWYFQGGTLTAGTVPAARITAGAGSGLDADLLDGISSASFLRSDTNTNYSGGVLGVYSQTGVDVTNTGQITGMQVYQPTANADALISFHIGGDYAVHFGLDGNTNDLTVGGWSMGAAKYKIWHEGNDGAGSTLNADLLDGISSASFLQATSIDTSAELAAILTDETGTGSAVFSANPTLSGTANATHLTLSGLLTQSDSGILVATKDDISARTESGFFQTSSATTGEGWPESTSNWAHLISSTHNNGANYYSLQIAGSFFDQGLYFRKTAGAGSTGWSRFLSDTYTTLANGANRTIQIEGEGTGVVGRHLYILGGDGGTGSAGGNVFIAGGAPGGVGSLGNVILGSDSSGTFGNVGIQDGSPTEAMLVVGSAGAGDIYLTLATAGTTNNAVCWDNAGATLLYDCDATPADYAESYPVDEGITYGDIVMTSNDTVIQTDGQTVSKLVKAEKGSEHAVIGIVSNNYHDFTSAGSESIDPKDNPMPVALSGRVPVKVNLEGGEIEVGDSVILSSEPGVATKATSTGERIGIALESYESGDDTVLVFVDNGMYYAPDFLAFITKGETELPDSEDTVFDKLITLAESFVDGVLKLASAEIEYVKADKVETNELCVGSVCVDEGTFLQMVEKSGGAVHAMEHDPEPEPEPEEETGTSTDNGADEEETGDPASEEEDTETEETPVETEEEPENEETTPDEVIEEDPEEEIPVDDTEEVATEEVTEDPASESAG